ncbi:hypothetical protein GQX74_012746 [Glossina fuscipes]|nr:hypothetical protein GQX74_012746 [Glossina fuscipes]
MVSTESLSRLRSSSIAGSSSFSSEESSSLSSSLSSEVSEELESLSFRQRRRLARLGERDLLRDRERWRERDRLRERERSCRPPLPSLRCVERRRFCDIPPLRPLESGLLPPPPPPTPPISRSTELTDESLLWRYCRFFCTLFLLRLEELLFALLSTSFLLPSSEEDLDFAESCERTCSMALKVLGGSCCSRSF